MDTKIKLAKSIMVLAEYLKDYNGKDSEGFLKSAEILTMDAIKLANLLIADEHKTISIQASKAA